MSSQTLALPALWRLCVALNIFGFALGHWMSDQHYRSILWNQSLLEGIISIFGISWEEWVGDTDYSSGIDQFRHLVGCGFALLAIAALVPLRHSIFRRVFVSIFSLCIGWVLVTRWAAHAYDFLWPAEFCLRLALPVVLLLLITTPSAVTYQRYYFMLLLACSLTFFGHGCYALGWYPTPVSFRYMLGNVISADSYSIDILLILIGVLDICIAAALWWRPAQTWILLWMCLWGFLTAFLRLSFIDTYFIADTAGPAIADWLERLAHGFIPLACWLILRQNRKTHIEEQHVQTAVT